MTGAENETEAAILSRRSVRGFLPTPVPRDVIEHLLDVAARAPSGTNMQPWRVVALSGAKLAEFCDGVAAAYLAGEDQGRTGHLYYPTPLPEPYLSRRRRIGWDLYGLLGIARGETEKARAHVVRNLHYFGAPVGLILTIDARLLIGSWIDMGMFLGNIAIAARARGLDTCPMAVFAEFPRAVRRLLELGEDRVVVCGMAIGHEDMSSPANRLRTEREPAAAFAEFRGF
ncbi:MAG TPA: nitroreductase [Acetobacteraceae bacterium]|jgi:nitroreductase